MLARRWSPKQRRVAGHAIRVTAAASIGFYLCLYGFSSAQMAVYAVFGCIAIGALSEVSGPPADRLVTYLVAFAIGVPLVVTGSLLARSTLLATAGMLVVGLLIGLAATGGGRLLGLANGLQLLYILPSFPPYVPDELVSRLVGLALGTGLLITADVLVRPAPGPPGFERRLSDSIGPLVDYLAAVRAWVCDPRPNGSRPSDEVRVGAHEAVMQLRPELLPVSRRPTGPSPYDHALRAAGMSLRLAYGPIIGLDRLLARRGSLPAEPAAAALIDVVCAQLLACRGVFDRMVSPRHRVLADDLPPADAIPAGIARFEAARLDIVEHLVLEQSVSETQLRFDSITAELASVAESVVLATLAAGGHPVDEARLGFSHQFTHQTTSTLGQWWGNLRIHLDPRSVILQNSVRLALGLAVARFVAGAFDLSHGFWVLLATLTLMRTTTTGTRGQLWPALWGTLLGAVAAGALLTAAGPHQVVFAIVMPFVLVAGLSAGQLGSPVLGQAAFTLVVASLFTQVTPSSWQLAGARLLDVVVGALIGVLTGVLVWPRGGAGPLRSALVAYLRESSRLAQQAVRSFGEPGSGLSDAQVRATRASEVLASATYAQFLAERPSGAADVPELVGVLGLARRLTAGSRAVRTDRVHEAGDEAMDAAENLLGPMSAVRAGAVAVLADAVERDEPPALPPIDDEYEQMSDWLQQFHGHHIPSMALDVVDARSWLVGVGHDVEEIAALADR